MSQVQFTEYMLPDGRQRLVMLDCSAESWQKARVLLVADCSFECEVLRTGEMSLTCERPDEDQHDDIEVLACVIAPNTDTEVVAAAVNELIASAYNDLLLRRSP